MDPWRLVGPERRGALEDMGTATVFLVSFVLIVAVTVVLFSGIAISPLSLGDLSQLGQSTLGVKRPAVKLDVTAPATPQALGVVPVAGSPVSQNAAQAVPAPATPTPTAKPEPSATPTPEALRFQVGNTGGDGVYLRRTANLDDRLIAWPDRTVFEVVGEDVDASGVHWKHVRDPRGNVGFVPSQYLVPAP